MTTEEIFSKINAHLAKGLMIHDQISNAFGFLNLCGYQKCHEQHYYEESINYREFNKFYLTYYHKLIPNLPPENVEIIPTSWYKYMRENVDTNTRRQSVRDLFKKWIEWETDTKNLLQTSYAQLRENNDFFAADKIMEMLKEVSDELATAYNSYINLSSTDYDIVFITEEQEKFIKEE